MIDKMMLEESMKARFFELMDRVFPEFVRLYESKKQKLEKAKGKVKPKKVVELSTSNISKAVLSRHVRRRTPTDNTSYGLRMRKKAEEEYARQAEVEKAALALPAKTKKAIISGAKKDPRRKPLPYNRPRR